MGNSNSQPVRRVDTSSLKEKYTETEVRRNINNLFKSQPTRLDNLALETSIESIGFNRPTPVARRQFNVPSSEQRYEDRDAQMVLAGLQQTAPQAGGAKKFKSRRNRYSKYSMDRIVAQKGGAADSSETEYFELSHDQKSLETLKAALKKERRNYRQAMKGGAGLESSSDRQYEELSNNHSLLGSFEQNLREGSNNQTQYGGADSSSFDYEPLSNNHSLLDTFERNIRDGSTRQQGGGDSSSDRQYEELSNNHSLLGSFERTMREGSTRQQGGYDSTTTPNRFNLGGGAVDSETSAVEFSFGNLPEFSETSKTAQVNDNTQYHNTSNEASTDHFTSYASSPQISSVYAPSPNVSTQEISSAGVSELVSSVSLTANSETNSEINALPFYNSDSSSDYAFRNPETRTRF